MSQKNEVVVCNENNKEITLPVIHWQDQQIMTLQQVARLHDIPLNNVQKDFRNNQKRFILGKHYFLFEGRKDREALLDANKENFSLLEKSFGDAIRWMRVGLTEPGYLLICKSLSDDLSWYVQECLVNSYYRLKDLTSKDPFDKIHSAIDEIKEMMAVSSQPAPAMLPAAWSKDIETSLDEVSIFAMETRDIVDEYDKALGKAQKTINSLASNISRINRENAARPSVKKVVESELSVPLERIREFEHFRSHIRSTVSVIIKDLIKNGCIQFPANSFVGKDHGTVPIADKAMSDEEKKQLAERNKLVYQKFKDELRICKDLAGYLGINTVSGNEHAKFIAKLCRELHFKPGAELLIDKRRTDKKGKEYRVYILSDEGIDKILSWWEKNKEKGELGEDFYGNPCRIYKFGKSIYRIAAESTNAESAAG